ncbi:protocadherin alpha-3-like [Hemibagrus wyckioides]|uniref:protocadherin alpha-3-like n=1 Tax=Hemibagrus wyckioides TaxID=337641 RepID=UPI00266C3115|nr:protocadherin alpha-3-like [Hemibagrus wyckioides]
MNYWRQRQRWEHCWIVLCFSVLMRLTEQVSTQIRYSVPEEVKDGTVVGNLAKDMGLDVSSLGHRRLRIVSGSHDDLFQVDKNNGVLSVHKKIDREEICDRNRVCTINLKIVIENPLEIHYIEVEIIDVNDNSPVFPENQIFLEISESRHSGARFELPAARDLDAGINSIRSYKLDQNDHFQLQLKNGDDEDKIIFVVLQKPLDREQHNKHLLSLTAFDGGNPPKSGTLDIIVSVIDVNDNIPVFSQEIYAVTVNENVPFGTIIATVNASDADDGLNGEIEYTLGRSSKSSVNDVFQLDSVTGEISVKGNIDYEENEVYRLNVQATDKGQPPMTVDCRVVIKVIDANDNKPEIHITSLSNMALEDSKRGTVIALVSVTDKDSGVNGKVICSLSGNTPFELKPSVKDNMYSLVTKDMLDRELVSYYDITIKATDLGQPPQSSDKSLKVLVADVNDNNPEFSQNPLELYLLENNSPGELMFSVSATDRDLNENAAVIYSIIRRDGIQNDIASFINVNAENGQIRALKSFDFEKVKTFQFHVLATDSGTPSLSSNVTVNVFILDQNDNVPVILYPVSANGSAEGVEEIPRNVNAGHLVTKVRAYDADIGYNGWLLFSLQEVSDHSLFGLDRYTGQIRTLRPFTETDEAEHKLVVLVKDNGNISLSATATLTVKLVEPKEAFAVFDVKNSVKEDRENNVIFYLIITLGSVSFLFIVSIVVLIVMQCAKSTDYSSKYLQETNYDGTLCHSIQYRSGDKRYMLVGPRTSIGSTLVRERNGNSLRRPSMHSREVRFTVFH